MEEIKERLKDITEIRSILEKETKFLSLSGLSGIWAGLTAMAGAAIAWFLAEDLVGIEINQSSGGREIIALVIRPEILNQLLLLAAGIILVAIAGSWFFSKSMAARKGLPFWNSTAKRMLLNLFVPLLTGGILSLIQLFQGSFQFIASNMLVFYGLALLNASKFTMNEIRYLGFSEIALGIACAVWWGHGYWFWITGFGLLHIVYGVWMYLKYER